MNKSIQSLPFELQEQILNLTFDTPKLEIEIRYFDECYNYSIFRLKNEKFVMKKVVQSFEDKLATWEKLLKITNPLRMVRSILSHELDDDLRLSSILIGGYGLEYYYVRRREPLDMDRAMENVSSYIAAAWGIGALNL